MADVGNASAGGLCRRTGLTDKEFGSVSRRFVLSSWMSMNYERVARACQVLSGTPASHVDVEQ